MQEIKKLISNEDGWIRMPAFLPVWNIHACTQLLLTQGRKEGNLIKRNIEME